MDRGTREMNANELAEIQAFKTEELTMWERNHTATMLRQQQAEIEALKKELALWRLSKSSEEIEATESDKFCDSHCVWTDHHPECKHAKYRR